MPLCTTAIWPRQSVWGWALPSEGLPWGCPAGVSQAGQAPDRVFRLAQGKGANFADGLAKMKVAGGVYDGNAGAVIPAIFQPL